MTATTAGRLRAAAIAVFMGAWALAAHYASSASGAGSNLNTALGVLPLTLMLGVLLWQLPSRLLRLLGAAAGVALLVQLWPQLRDNIALLYYLQHLAAHLALAALFGGSLRGQGDALITRMARIIYGDTISARKVRYTRQATFAWTLFFIANASVSTALFLFAPHAIWSLHANLLTWPLIGLMFLAELGMRHRLLPPEERPRFADIVAAYRRLSRRQPTP